VLAATETWLIRTSSVLAATETWLRAAAKTSPSTFGPTGQRHQTTLRPSNSSISAWLN